MIEAVIVDVLEMLELRDRRIFISYLFESMVKNNDGSFPVLYKKSTKAEFVEHRVYGLKMNGWLK